MTTTIRRFTGPKVPVQRKGVCPDCNKRVTKSHTVEGTVNPFNKRPDGEPKTWDEVRADCLVEAEAWQPKDWRCTNCRWMSWVQGLTAWALECEIVGESQEERSHRRVSTGHKLADKCAERIRIFEARLEEIGGSAEVERVRAKIRDSIPPDRVDVQGEGRLAALAERYNRGGHFDRADVAYLFSEVERLRSELDRKEVAR